MSRKTVKARGNADRFVAKRYGLGLSSLRRLRAVVSGLRAGRCGFPVSGGKQIIRLVTIECADARVGRESGTRQSGFHFSVSTAGGVLSEGNIDSVAYAVQHHDSPINKTVIVLFVSHTNCGMVGAFRSYLSSGNSSYIASMFQMMEVVRSYLSENGFGTLNRNEVLDLAGNLNFSGVLLSRTNWDESDIASSKVFEKNLSSDSDPLSRNLELLWAVSSARFVSENLSSPRFNLPDFRVLPTVLDVGDGEQRSAFSDGKIGDLVLVRLSK